MSSKSKISVRVHTSAYLSAGAAFSFVSAYLLYISYDVAAFVAAGAALIVYPVLAFGDRVEFDGKRIGRTGPIWQLFRLVTGQQSKVKPRAVIHVETETVRALRRGANVFYLYRTSLYSADLSFCIGSGRGYRAFIGTVLPMVTEGCLDVRSAELRDHFIDAGAAMSSARSLNIPASDVLDSGAIIGKRERQTTVTDKAGDDAVHRSDELRTVANQLRANGRLVQSLEAFRRALRLTPRNGRLIYEFARCLQSFAAAKRDPKLDRKAQAMLRLAERRSAGDTDLLTRLGETYFSSGAWRRAENAFKKAAASGTAGYRIFRGLGELALRDGKIAHAVNHFAHSAEVAKPSPLFRWAKAEADYLRRLNDDDEYMELEISRINLFDTFDGARVTSMRIFCFGVPLIVIGLFAGLDVVAEIGWAVSGVAMLIWLASSILKQIFASRIPFDLFDKEK